MHFKIQSQDRPVENEIYNTLLIVNCDGFNRYNSVKVSNEEIRHSMENDTDLKHYEPTCEIIDSSMLSFPQPIVENYIIAWYMEEGDDEGNENELDNDLPADLSPPEIILTDVLWGKKDKGTATLLLGAFFNMDIGIVGEEIDKLGLF